MLRPGKFLRSAAVVLGCVVVVLAAFPLLVGGERLRPQLERRLAEVTGRRVQIKSVGYSWRHLSLVANDLLIAEDPAFGRVPFVQSRTVEMHVPLWSLIFGNEPRVSRMVLQDPTIVFKQNAVGKWNYSSLLGVASPSAFPQIEIHGGRLGMETESAQFLELRNLELTVPEPEPRRPLPFTLTARVGRGTLQVKGQAGPVDTNSAQPVLPLNALLHLDDVNLLQWIPSANAPGLRAQLSIDGSLESNGHSVELTGQAELNTGFASRAPVEPLDVIFTVQHDLDLHTGHLSRFEIRVSKGSASMSGRYDSVGSTVQVDLGLSMAGAPVIQLAPLLPLFSVTLPTGATLEGGLVGATLKVQGPLDHLSFSGPLHLDDTHLNHFFLSQRLQNVSGLDAEGLDDSAEILSWHGQLESLPNGIGVRDVVADIAGLGELTGSGTAFADGRLAFTMAGTRGLTGPKGAAIPFTIGGTTFNPLFQPVGQRP